MGVPPSEIVRTWVEVVQETEEGVAPNIEVTVPTTLCLFHPLGTGAHPGSGVGQGPSLLHPVV